jgi:phosphoribosylaminoimidazole-succinocarboxamide synthase
LASPPAAGEPLDHPLVEFTTKREEIDRFVDRDEARAIGGLRPSDLARIVELVEKIDVCITAHAESVGLEHADGKVEFGMLEPGEIVLVDNAGTPDENRFLFDGKHVGKQLMRDHYLVQGLERSVQEWAAAGRPRSSWPTPEPLPPGFVSTLSDMYRALAERWIGEPIWGAPPLEDLMETAALLDSGAVRW